MQFKDFEIRPTRSLDDVIDPKRFELVKWYEPGHCFVVAWLEYYAKEMGFEIKSVGLRLVENWVDGLDKFIVKWCEMAAVCMEEDE